MQATCSCLLSFLLLICIVYSSKISPRVVSLLTLKQETRNAGSEEQVHLWVYFSDKDLQVPYEVVLGQLHPNALQRRSKVMNSNSNSNNGFVDLHDYPVNGHYITQVEACGVVVRRTSKWLNAVSFHTSLTLSPITLFTSLLPLFLILLRLTLKDIMLSVTIKSYACNSKSI